MSRPTRVALFVAIAALLGASAASAYTVTATLNSTSTTIANGYTDNGDGTVTADLTAGDVITVDIWASNAVGDSLDVALTSIRSDDLQSTALGGNYSGAIFAGTCSGSGCSPPRLYPSGDMRQKLNSPNKQATSTEAWTQIVNHFSTGQATDGAGAAGLGDFVGTLYFQYVGVGGFDPVAYEVGRTPGDTVSGPNGPASVEIYNSLYFNVPEPSAALLLGLGLAGLGAVRRRD